MGQVTVNAFTSKYNGLVNSLIVKAGVSKPYDPNVDHFSPPRIIEVNSLWDTGATNSSITLELAEKLGIRNTMLSEMEHGRRTITVNTLQQYADLFGIKISTIQAFAGEIKRNKNLKKEIFNEIMKVVVG